MKYVLVGKLKVLGVPTPNKSSFEIIYDTFKFIRILTDIVGNICFASYGKVLK